MLGHPKVLDNFGHRGLRLISKVFWAKNRVTLHLIQSGKIPGTVETIRVRHALGATGRASHRTRKHTAIRVFYTGTRTVPFGLAVQYLTAATNTDVYRIEPFNLLP